MADPRDTLRDAARETLVHGAFFLPAARRKAIDRWLRGREEYRKLQQADVVFLSWAKSGRTWLRLMLSRFYQLRFGLPETAFLEFDNLQRRVPEIPSVFYTHDNYLRDYTGDLQNKRHFHDKRILFMVRDPRDVAVSQYFQWRYRMRPWKKFLNDYPTHGQDVSIYDFVMHAEAGLKQILEFYDVWAREMPNLRDVHLVRYEDLRARTEQVLGEVLAFLGTPAKPEELAEAVRYARVENMRQIERSGTFWRSGRRLAAGDKDNPDSFKVRRAKVGGWRDYFDDEQVAAIDARVSESLSPIYGYEGSDGSGAKSDDPGRAASTP